MLAFLRERRLEYVAHHERIHVFVYLAVNDHNRSVRAVAGAQARAEVNIDFILQSAFSEKALARLYGLLVPARETGTAHADDYLWFRHYVLFIVTISLIAEYYTIIVSNSRSHPLKAPFAILVGTASPQAGLLLELGDNALRLTLLSPPGFF